MRAQFVDSSSGLLQMPSAEMHADGVFSITNNYLNRHSLPTSGWSYDTFSYGFNLAFWDRFEVGYVLTIFDGRKGSSTRRMYRMSRQISRRSCRRFSRMAASVSSTAAWTSVSSVRSPRSRSSTFRSRAAAKGSSKLTSGNPAPVSLN